MKTGSPVRSLLVFVAALVCAVPCALAADPQPSPPATLQLWNRPITTLRETVGGRTPAERAAWMAERIDDLPADSLRGEIEVAPSESLHGHGIELEIGGIPVLRLYAGDLDPESGETLEQAGTAAASHLREALDARLQQRDARQLVRGSLFALGATALFAALVFALTRSRRFVTARLFLASERSLRGVSRLGVDPRRYLLLGAKYAVDGLAFGLTALLGYLWLTFVFVQFPYSAPWGARLGQYLLDLARYLASQIIGAIPEFFTVVVIMLVTRALSRLVSQLFQAVQQGRLQLGWVESETAEATRRIVIAVIWLFALTAAFPFIPGSDSPAFRGIGVLAGLMLSLGSAGIVNQAMSGLVVVYSRTFREGDYVRIGDVEGTVMHRGSLSTKIRSIRNEEVTLPNGVVVAAPTVNYTRLANGHGALVSAAVTIGYDAPWRQVHALLALAASRTPGIRSEPVPFVAQRALSDWYVEYEIVAHAEISENRPLVLSRLHAEIQDAFNEHAVQIMSPHFLGQPAGKVVVPREGWSPPPAVPDAGGSAIAPSHPGR